MIIWRIVEKGSERGCYRNVNGPASIFTSTYFHLGDHPNPRGLIEKEEHFGFASYEQLVNWFWDIPEEWNEHYEVVLIEVEACREVDDKQVVFVGGNEIVRYPVAEVHVLSKRFEKF